jgi:ureidoglycolate lyase
MANDIQRKVRARALDARKFLEFGEVVTYNAEGGRHMIDAVFEMDLKVTEPRFWVNALPSTPPDQILIKALEQHPYSSQTFIPLGITTCMAVVCGTAEDGGPDLEQLKAFLVPPGKGICYNRGTWHSGFMSIGKPNEVAVIMGLSGGLADTRIIDIGAEVIMDCLFEGAAR